MRGQTSRNEVKLTPCEVRGYYEASPGLPRQFVQVCVFSATTIMYQYTSSRRTLDGVFIYHYIEIELLYRFCYLRNKFFCIIFNQNAFVYFAYCFVYKFDIMICFKHLFTWGPTSSFVKKTNRGISLNTFIHQHICYNAFQKEN